VRKICQAVEITEESACILALTFQILNGSTMEKPEEKIGREHFVPVGKQHGYECDSGY